MKTLEELQGEIARWQKATFPGQTVEKKIQHLASEVAEMAAAPRDISERADALILLLGINALHGKTGAELLCAASAKLEINRRRKWGPPDENGIYRHIPEAV